MTNDKSRAALSAAFRNAYKPNYGARQMSLGRALALLSGVVVQARVQAPKLAKPKAVAEWRVTPKLLKREKRGLSLSLPEIKALGAHRAAQGE